MQKAIMSFINIKIHDKLDHSQQRREKIQELKEKSYKAVFRKREHRCWTEDRKILV